MKVAVFSTKPYDRTFLETANADHNHEIHFFTPHMNHETVSLAAGFDAICIFVNDDLTDADAVATLAANGTKLVALRAAGFNNVNLAAAAQHGLTVVRVPAYSPYAVAEHTLALLLALNRRIPRAYNRTRDGNFALDGLLGFDVHGRTVGVIGTGKIGIEVIRLFTGFGCTLLAHDPHLNETAVSLGVSYVDLPTLFAQSDIVTLHCPLTPQTYHIIDKTAVSQMKQGATLINTSRGGLVDTTAVIEGLKSGQIGLLGLDVYEEEADLFFEDLSGKLIRDDVFARLLTFPNVLVTGHQAFFTQEALTNIADTTVQNITEFEQSGTATNKVTLEGVTG